MGKFLKSNCAGLSILAAGVLFIGLGIFRGEVGTVLMKAVSICLECVGIG
ncbi:MAG: CD1871A family CXXC motif-containing protein [Blautia sp.]|jgi:hypothetical protein